MLFQWVCRNRNSAYKPGEIRTHTRKQVILLKTLSKQRNVISMGLSKQKSSPLDSYKKFNQEASIIEILCRNSVMLFQWDCRNRKSSPLDSYKKFNKEVTIRNTVSKQCNVISMGLLKQESSALRYSV